MKSVFNFIKYLVLLAIALGIVWYSLRKVDTHEVWQSIKGANFYILIPTFIILMLSHWIRAMRWNLIIDTLHYHPRTWQSFFALLFGYFTNLFVPRLGEVLRCTALSKKAHIPLDKLVGTVIIERFIDMVGLGLVTLLAFSVQIELIGDFVRKELLERLRPLLERLGPQQIIIGIIILIAIVVALFFLLRCTAKYPIVKKVIQILKNVWEGIVSIRKLGIKEIVLFIVHTFLIWFCYYLAIVLGCEALASTKDLALSTSLSFLVTGSVGMILTQGGIGAYPLLIAETAKWYGVSYAQGTALGWLLWASQIAMTIAAGIVAWFVLLPVKAKK